MTTIAKPTSQDWEIRNRADTCRATERKFLDNEPFFSRLVLTPEGYVREDYSTGAWTDGLKSGAISSWKSVFRAPPPPKADPVKKEDIETTLRDLMAKGDPASLNAIFVLAVLLERKRVLAEKDVQLQPDGRKLRVYEHKLTGEAFVVTDPELQLSQLEAVQDEVVAILGWHSNAIPAPAPSSAADPGPAPVENQPMELDLENRIPPPEKG